MPVVLTYKIMIETTINNRAEEKISTFARIVIDLPITISSENYDYFYYKIPNELLDKVKPGMIVKVPFGKQDLCGYVIGIEDNVPKDSTFTIKEIYETIYEREIWNKNYLAFAKWLSEYYLTNLGTVLSASIISQILDNSTAEVELNKDFKDFSLLSPDQAFIIDKFANSKKKSLTYRHLIQDSKLTKQKFYHLINQLKSKNILLLKQKKLIKEKKETIRFDSNIAIDKEINIKELVLNKDQEKAYKRVSEAIALNKFDYFLLHGVTGSGKTEVYLRLIEEALKKNKTVIYLVPEIYLVPQIYQRLITKFDKSSVIIWHSTQTIKERINNFEKVIDDKINGTTNIKIVLGARSACLIPLDNLGLVIIDEAHDGSYKQASPAPRYDAIKASLKRAEIENAVVVMGTATPNITEYYGANIRNNILELPTRIENVPMPEIAIVDLKDEVKKQNRSILSGILKLKISEALERKEQVVLLLNRRGYASHIFCRACGFIQFCNNCSVPLVFHKNLNEVICHHCGYSKKFNTTMACPECRSPHFKYFGFGIEQLEEDVKNQFKEAKILRIDSDKLKGKDKYIELWKEFASGEADILIGTQIVAKGLDLPSVTVVGVIFADTMFNFPDYISHERAFQLLTQVSGRAGRGDKPGKVFIQTYQPELPIFKYIKEHDYNTFYKAELKEREEFKYPPFANITRIIVQSLDEKECISHAHEVKEILSTINHELLTILGPAPCFFSKLHNKFRFHILIKTEKEEVKKALFETFFQKYKKSAKVELIVDIDSVNLL
jgi:primosomal protein N' (replication factor Y)